MNLCEPLLDSIGAARRAAIDANMGCYRLEKGDTAAAKEFFLRSQMVCPDRKSSLYLGDIYAKEGDTKRAVQLWYDATNSADTHIRKDALHRLIAQAEDRGNVESALYLSNMLNGIYAKDISNATATAIATAQTDFDRRQAERRDRAARLLLVAAVALALGGTVIFITLSRRRDKRKERSASRWNIESRFLQADCVHRLHRFAATGKTAPKDDWDALHELISLHDKPLAVLLERHKNLTAAEIGIIMLTRLRFLPSEIATLTGSSSQTVTNTRARLLRKVFGKEGRAKDLDKMIREA